ncbi:alpha- and gamma-adaptin-binding protein p34-like [Linepithema humile]|uniref:alpha- and gamma-adaptin-binding protein p34-like n=1 Tax=Linepithema humile TaxID=83485 RepID=UPI000623B0C7|nr:PREDICTED: alpha- and gamma-adaptin-binding protein p34-like [Linepithema humile]XP_012216548.1 PREDICTED: alpha- and gamma-adaptin-binding protein p34-like [Linepithema humile]XP_012216549.1 PREDICTED: alpha- and gamma-adaptin-binding protein p34-like [Linepithema humile]XP_012216550.1 PREDICTED: alpha- and gamma-adaptin-binding protein p34-like [Linepithema humile]XP_012216551.1 PREDICTED: alpha- and gamma-adaptin-binding protein p34-like [Linepithema humile]
MNLPRVLIVSTKEGKAKEIAENIGAERLSEEGDIVNYLWNIDNKYYTSQVLICITESISQKFLVEGINALIIYHDPQADKVDQELEYLASLITSLTTAEILLFSCNAISDVLLRDKVLNWCLSHKFELVELEQTGNTEPDPEGNKYGIERIVEALHAHTWPNIVLKDKPSTAETLEVNDIGEQFENIQLTRDTSERLQMQDMLESIMDSENADFGELFGQFMAMKEHAASLPTNERRIMAEQVVTAFWKAMGGDLLEIED